MSYWRWILLSWVAITAAFSLSGCTLSPSATAQTDLQTATPFEPTLSYEGTPPEWAQTATEVMMQLEDWRNLSFNESLQVTFETQVDPNLNGYYNSETKKLSVAADASEALGRGVLLHEIFHALQDQNFDLYQLRIQSASSDDRDKALSAIIEGEAMLAVAELMNYNFLAHARLPESGEISEAFFSNLFLYGSGLQFIEAIRAEGGWAAVNEVFQDPPQATMLILNPERYLAGERTSPKLEIPLAAGEQLEAEQIRGAYQVQWLFAQQPELRSQLPRLAKSYLTDTLAIVSTPDGIAHRWIVELESAADAEALTASFITALKAETATQTVAVSTEGSKILASW